MIKKRKEKKNKKTKGKRGRKMEEEGKAEKGEMKREGRNTYHINKHVANLLHDIPLRNAHGEAFEQCAVDDEDVLHAREHRCDVLERDQRLSGFDHLAEGHCESLQEKRKVSVILQNKSSSFNQ
jgi:hypothetical protein